MFNNLKQTKDNKRNPCMPVIDLALKLQTSPACCANDLPTWAERQFFWEVKLHLTYSEEHVLCKQSE